MFKHRLLVMIEAGWMGFAVLAVLGMGTAELRNTETKGGPAFAEEIVMPEVAIGDRGPLCPKIEFGNEVLMCSPEQHFGMLAATSDAVWPLPGRITSGFGYRRSPFYARAADFHEGIDIAARRGMPILAAVDGVVTFAGFQGGYGRMIVIDHGFGISSVYGHASRLFVSKGLWVKGGTVIGLVGSSGAATGPHLHYEFRMDTVPFDPRSLYQEENPWPSSS